MSWWSGYPAESFGRVIHFIYHYCSFNHAESCIIGNHEVRYYDKLLAKIIDHKEITLFGHTTKIPVFEFYDDYYKKRQEAYEKLATFTLKEYRDNIQEYTKKYAEVYHECFQKDNELNS